MSVLEVCYGFRSELVERLRTDLIGPTSEDEELRDAPVTRYAVGILFPENAGDIDDSESVDVESAASGDEVGFGDPAVALANTRYAPSMGLTCAIDPGLADSVTIRTRASRYEPVESEAGGTRWRRRAIDLPPVRLGVTEPGTRTHDLGEGLELFTRVRALDAAASVAITVALVNRRSGQYPRDPDCFFQPSIEIATDDRRPCFVERRQAGPGDGDKELASYRLLYRHARTFAVGHGCAAEWDEPEPGGPVSCIRSAWIPAHALRLVDSNPSIDADVLRLTTLYETSRERVVQELRGFSDGYRTWISSRVADLEALDPDLGRIGTEHMADCTRALERMEQGIDTLGRDDRAWRAFTLANQAMHHQRARATWHEQGRPAPGPELAGWHAWRPFQLAFILTCITGIVDPEHADRGAADLLWFPTGGGKTEAYLGLIAFTIFHRRLRDGADGDGVAVVMRYTLRLLTIQQFERAALLMCCCEVVRADRPELGEETFSIGLWVGRQGTPNTLKDADEALQKMRADGQEPHEGNPRQLHRCPWCGSSLSVYDYSVNGQPPALRIRCSSRREPSSSCPFTDALPVAVVDEQIYSSRPSLLIATADKFAALPWRPETRRIFGLGTSSRPPELIVQDELHLISGPLGTLTGLYETAVDALCTFRGAGPKVIASTATIRRADRQTQALFARTMRQFPPPGLDARDSYFATEAPPDAKATRMYLGVMAPAVSQTTLMVRVYAALLQGTLELEGSPEARDPYWTLVGYFNSLRVLGGARMQVQDDVADRLELIADTGPARSLAQRIELTSREPSGDIPGHLDHMKVRHPREDALDVILATNMISVGVDIDRLGLMVVMGQPQSTAEYIQSTSRVGRRFPGLVPVLYNASRSRDRSHYESFHGYHSALYRQVESTSVTPFSSRARDRALHAVLIALARLRLAPLEPNDGAGTVASELAALEILCREILERVARVAEAEEIEPTRRQLESIVKLWRERAERGPKLFYNKFRDPDQSLLVEAAEGGFEEGRLPTLWSLRDVDRESNLYLI